MYCHNCGSKTTEEGKFCIDCGEVVLDDVDFNGWDNEPSLPRYDNDDLYGDSLQRERITVESREIETSISTTNIINMKDIPKCAIAYFRKNWFFITTIFVMWNILGVENHGTIIYKIPIISQIYKLLTSNPLRSILIYFTATYNGPVGFFGRGLTPYTFVVALAGKSAYLLAMTGVVIPSVKALIKNKSHESNKYKDNASKVIEIVKSLPENLNLMGFALAGCGLSLAVSNLLTRNGKIDKTFVLILLSFVLFKGLSGVLPSAIDFIARYIMAFFTRIMPGGMNNSSEHYKVLRIGAMIGFLLAVIIGSIGKNVGYILGGILIISGSALAMVKKEMA